MSEAEKPEQLCDRCRENPADYIMAEVVETGSDDAIVHLCDNCFSQTMKRVDLH